jgi:subtilase family serine protease
MMRFAAAVITACLAYAQPVITGAIDETKLVTLGGNTRPEATPGNDRGPVSDDFALDHMLLQLKRSPAREAALDDTIAQLHDPDSPDFHHWLTPEQFAAQFGVDKADVDSVTGWMKSHGFTIHGVQASGMMIDFSGTAGQVKAAFHTEIHNLVVNGAAHIANMTDPRIPEALAPAVTGIVSLHNFHPTPLLVSAVARGQYTFNRGAYHALVPGDVATIYNLAPLFRAGISGQGQTIMVLEDTYLYSTEDWVTFREKFDLASAYPQGSLTQESPSGAMDCTNPGFQDKPSDPGYGDDSEAAIDVELSTAAAPSAAIVLAACTDTTTTFGGLIALENVLNGPAAKLPSVVSIGYGEAETGNGAAANAAYNSAYKQAVSEGVSIFVAAGDEGAASYDDGFVAQHGITISGFASSPYDVAVGGTDFGYTADNVPASTYWSSTNRPDYSSALSYIQEVPWNDSCAGSLVATFLNTTPLALCNSPQVTSPQGADNFLLIAVAGSGGPSGCATGSPSVPGVVSGTCAGWAKPSYQTVIGNPPDGVRDIPDVSLFASNGFWDAYYVICWSDPNTAPAVGGGYTCKGAPSTWAGFGGTSTASPVLAGIQVLVNQHTGSRWGNPNVTYYSLANSEYSPFATLAGCNSNRVNKTANNCIFYDITQGDNNVVCQALNPWSTYNCYTDGRQTYGLLSIFNSFDVPAYAAAPGWDFTTGIGSVNAYNLVMNWPMPK